MTRFQSALKKRMLLSDGGFGSMLSAMGVISKCPDELSVTQPDTVKRIYEMYLNAGADILTSATFGSNDISLAKKGRGGKSREYVNSAVSLARAVAGDSAFIALDIGPTSEFPYPVGTLKFYDFYKSFRAQAEAALDAGADIAIIETQTDIAECRAAALALRDVGLPFIASFTFEPNGRTLTGGLPECAAIVLNAIGALAVGANCSAGPDELLPILRNMRAVTGAPIIAQPNAGLPSVLPDGKAAYPYTPGIFSEKMRGIVDNGVNIIGGCCGTTPDHIRALKPLTKNKPAAIERKINEYVCSTRSFMRACDIVDVLEPVSDADDIYDLENDRAPIIDLRDISPDEAYELTCEAEAASRMPVAFSADADCEGALASALRAYSGIAAVSAPQCLDHIIEKHGAVRI